MTADSVRLVQIDDVAVEHAAVEPWQHAEGEPTTGARQLGALGGVRYGVWELRDGSMLDVEVDEVFLVTGGSARIEFLEPVLPALDVRPGSLVRLEHGMRTRWTVGDEPLRKLYLVADPGEHVGSVAEEDPRGARS